MGKFSKTEQEDLLNFDIRRSLILANYVKYWGQPSTRTISKHRKNPFPVEIYEFPGGDEGVYRFATIGVSSQNIDGGQTSGCEFLLCLPGNLGGVTSERVVTYLLDIVASSLVKERATEVGDLMPPSRHAPQQWSTTAILFDEARGEEPELSLINIGAESTELLWLVPITKDEYQLVKYEGIEKFDELEATSEVSLLDVNRKGLV